MKFSLAVAGSLALAASADQSICDKYTSALFQGKGGNSAANQETLLILVVNTAVIGNYSSMNTGVTVPGILANGTYEGTNVQLLPYFDGSLASSNTGKSCGRSVNFLDGGGAAPLMKNMPADNKTSNQYFLLTHLYEFFASLLGCSKYGNTVHKYAGGRSMYDVHKFMSLGNAELGWFIQNVGLSAESFGVTQDDAEAVGNALMELFGYRCEPEMSIPPVPSPHLQSICTDCSCPLSKNATCSAYGPILEPKQAGMKHPTCRMQHKNQKMCDSS